MKRKLAWIGVILSALYLLTVGPIPDPIPFIDEGMALALLLKCATYLGYDLRSWLPFSTKPDKKKTSEEKTEDKEVTIDV